jgi:hypothetical protein
MPSPLQHPTTRHSILIERLKKAGDERRGKPSQCFDAQNKYVRYIDRDV